MTAVVVSHDGAAWLPQTLAGLTAQRRPAQRVLGVDSGSQDRSRSLLVAALGKAWVLQAPPEAGFGEAVAHALAADAGAPGTAAEGTTEWLWLLHDDSAPAPDALQQLLAVAADTPSAGILGCKAVGWDDDRRLLEVGFTAGPGGHRETGLDAAEVDQGQHDTVRDVLAVGSAGMLVRRDVWDQLAGFDPRLPLWRDDLDLCWRARAAGHRVLVVPAASVRHAEAASRGLRAAPAGGHRPWRADRAHALYVLLAHARASYLPFALARVVVGSLLRAVGLLLGKRSKDSYDELAALVSVIGRPRRIVEARRRRSATRSEPHSAIRPYLAGRMTRLRHLADAASRRVSRWSAELGVNEEAVPQRAVESGPSAFDDDLDDGGGHLLRRLLGQPPVVMVLGLLGLSLLATRHLVGGGAVVGGALLGAPEGAADLWRAYAAGWHEVGLGTDSTAGPMVAVLAGLAGALAGKAGAAVGLLLFGGVPLAALSAYLSGRSVLEPRWLRAGVATTYALLPPLTGALAAGRLGAVVAHVLLPPLALISWRTLGPRAASGWRGVAGTGLLAAVVVSAAPVLYPLLVLAWVVTAVLAGGGARERPLVERVLRPAALAPLPLLLLSPWSLEVMRHPSLLLLEPGLTAPGLADPRVSPWQLALVWPGGPALPWVWLGAPLLALALVGLLRRDGARLARAAWALALAALLGAVLVARTAVTTEAGDRVVGWPGPLLSASGLGIVMAAAVASRGARVALRQMSFSWRQPAAGLLAVAAAVGLVGLAGSWARGDSLLHRVQEDLRPAFVVADAQTGREPRTLVLSDSGARVAYDLLGAEPVGLAEADIAPSRTGVRQLNQAVQDLVAGRGNATAERLVTYGVRYVAVRAPAAGGLVRALDGTAGLSRLAVESRTLLWQVVVPSGGMVVLDADASEAARGGQVPAAGVFTDHPPLVLAARGDLSGRRAQVPPASGDRLLVLPQGRDSGWRATLDGRPLRAATAWGWAQAFALPSDAGHLQVTYVDAARTRALWLQAVLVALTLIVAAPSARRRGLGPARAEDARAEQ